ncbi:hypothetical protein B7760_05086 [Burkholderia glumae]|nr:gp33 domain protein [Burkholderia glumae LMG 2196 = ATCC 33617]QKM51021.1 hypothetical protein B7760_05086 [Burkholderia glumae]QKM55575.1 hypothetical protein CG017_03635 [Burkholderia glumae]QTP35000.1 hypothetical protein B7759_03622 [Burkholderia glumae]
MLARSSRFMDGYLRANEGLPLDHADIDRTQLKTCGPSLTRCSLLAAGRSGQRDQPAGNALQVLE